MEFPDFLRYFWISMGFLRFCGMVWNSLDSLEFFEIFGFHGFPSEIFGIFRGENYFSEWRWQFKFVKIFLFLIFFLFFFFDLY